METETQKGLRDSPKVLAVRRESTGECEVFAEDQFFGEGRGVLMGRSYLWSLCLFSSQVNKILNEVV